MPNTTSPKHRAPSRVALIAFSLLVATACERRPSVGPSTTAGNPADVPADGVVADGEVMRLAVAELAPVGDSGVRGTVTFTPAPGGILVTAEISGLTPGEHGMHVHEHGDCSAPDASSAGGHFNPTGAPHAGRDAERRHVGDLGNVRAGEGGRAQLDYVDTHLALDGPNSIVGRAVIVHARADDLATQPSGDSGDRIACGVIRMP
jgi:Cu-Zn family superoxide dismutase